VVCEALAKELDPLGKEKTLIFCATDGHADLVVHLLRQAFVAHYGTVPNEAVAKITGASDRPAECILPLQDLPQCGGDGGSAEHGRGCARDR
jgi:type I restriction enzyme R subunit